jgi:hypothetical protein
MKPLPSRIFVMARTSGDPRSMRTTRAKTISSEVASSICASFYWSNNVARCQVALISRIGTWDSASLYLNTLVITLISIVHWSLAEAVRSPCSIREMIRERVLDEIAAGVKASSTAVPRELVVQFVVGAYMAVLTWWLDHGAKPAPEQMDAMFRRLAIHGIDLQHC